jgi:hypothetical protein
MKRITMLAATAAALAFPAAGLSDPGGQSGTYCGASANGCAHSMANTECAGHGGFGAFGKDNNFAGGANGDATAFNNSTLCGNPQGAAGQLNP